MEDAKEDVGRHDRTRKRKNILIIMVNVTYSIERSLT